MLWADMPSSAAEQWSAALGAWARPPEILAAAPERPGPLPPEPSAHAAERALADGPRPAQARALEALPAGGSVLDIGVGGGAASLPLAPPAGLLVGVDESQPMLESFGRLADERGVAHREV